MDKNALVFNNQNTSVSTVVKEDNVLHDQGARYTLAPETSTLITSAESDSRVKTLVDTHLESLVSIVDPVIISPINGEVYSGIITTSGFSVVGSHIGSHDNTDWEIATDSEFKNIEVSSYKDRVNLRTFTFYPNNVNTTYYVRVKYRSNMFESKWSTAAYFISGSEGITTPVLYIAETPLATTLNPTFLCGDFIMLSGEDTHIATQWNIARDSDFKTMVYSKEDTSNLLSYKHLESLTPNTSYYVRMRFKGNKYLSNWSNVLAIKTGEQAETPILSGDTYIFENSTGKVIINNYNPLYQYNVSSNIGNIKQINDTIYISVPSLTEDVDLFINVVCSNVGINLIDSDACIYKIRAVQLPTTSDTIIDTQVHDLQRVNEAGNFNLEPNRNKKLNILDMAYDVTTNKIYIDNKLYDPSIGDTLYYNDDKEFTVKEFGYEGESFSIYGIKKIVFGSNHVMVLTHGGLLYVAGDNSKGQLGLGDNTNRSSLTLSAAYVDDIDTNYMFSAYIRKDGELRVTGDNQYGQLGIGTYNDSNVWVRPISTFIKTVSIGYYHMVFVTRGGDAYGTGYNGLGQLGLGDSVSDINYPVLIASGIDEVSCGHDSTIFKTLDGYLAYCGNNYDGQLGLSTTIAKVSSYTKTTTKVKRVFFSNRSTYYIDNNGLLMAAGVNDNLQLGITDSSGTRGFKSTGMYPIDVIVAGGYTFVKNNDGKLYVAGKDTYGILGTGLLDHYGFTEYHDQDIILIAEKSTGYNIITVNNSGIAKARGINALKMGLGEESTPVETPVEYFNNKDINTYKTGMYIIPETPLEELPDIIYDTKRHIRYKEFKQEDDESDFKIISNIITTEKGTDILDSSKTVTKDKLFIKDYLTMLKVGDKLVSDTGDIITVNDILDDTIINTTSPIKNIYCNNQYGCWFVLLENGDLYASGGNLYNQSGLGTYTTSIPYFELTFQNVKEVFTGTFNVFVVDNSGKVYASGLNDYGQLGINTVTIPERFTLVPGISNPKKITSSMFHTVVINNDDIVYTAGRSYYNCLMLSKTDETKVLQFTSTGIKAKDAIAGHLATFIVGYTDNKLYGIGNNYYGELGLGDKTPRTTLTYLGYINITNLVTGYSNVAFIRDTGKVIFAGSFYRLSTGTNNIVSTTTFKEIPGISVAKKLTATITNLLVTDVSNDLYGYGFNFNNTTFLYDNENAESGFIKTKHKAVDIYTNTIGTLIKTPEDEYYFIGLITGNIACEYSRVHYVKPTKVRFDYPVFYKYKPNKWIVPKEDLTTIPTKLYPLLDISFNNSKAIPTTATINNEEITVIRNNVELEPTRYVETKVHINKGSSLIRLQSNIEKV